MRRMLRRLSSARARLIFWNTVTFALVLLSLGALFRVLAERSLRTALDREMHLQAGRFRDAKRIEMYVLSDKLAAPRPGAVLVVKPLKTGGARFSGAFAPQDSPVDFGRPAKLPVVMAAAREKWMRVSGSHITASSIYRITENVGAPSPDKSGQFLYRSFDLNGKPFAPPEAHMPFTLPAGESGSFGVRAGPERDYRPWDHAGFIGASRGQEQYADTNAGGTPLRILSLPLKHDGKIAGVVQIAAPLGPITRDIAGLTRALLLVLPLSLLVAVVAGIFLTERALRPVKEMTRAAAGIQADQLSLRLPVSGADEFDELASTFNAALERVETAFDDRERAIAQLRRFTADASHELRTPLTTIKANTGVALTDAQPSPEHVHALRQIDRAADRMTAVVQDLLLLARSDAGQLALDRSAVSLSEVVQDAIDSLPHCPHAPISFETRDVETLVCGDHEHLRRLFLNLLQNAVRHTPREGRIAIAITRTGGQAAVCVQDSGCGIAAEHLPLIGQPFYRVDAGRDRRHGGAGLGLAICRSIAAAHGASIDIVSRPNEGTAITVAFRTLSDLTATM